MKHYYLNVYNVVNNVWFVFQIMILKELLIVLFVLIKISMLTKKEHVNVKLDTLMIMFIMLAKNVIKVVNPVLL